MYINISACYLLVRSTRTGQNLPVITVSSDYKIRISGLDNNPSSRKQKGIFEAILTLETATSAVVIANTISIYLMNTGLTVTCFITNEKDYFRIIQQGKEKLSDYSAQGYYYAFERIGHITVETDNEKETDKHGRF